MIRRSWMMVASIETTLELWALSLREIKARMVPLFTQERVARSAGLFLDGLLGAERRKTGWMRAEAAGDAGPWRQQAILGRGRWDGDALRDIVRDYVVETLAADDAVLVIDETGVSEIPFHQSPAPRHPQRGFRRHSRAQYRAMHRHPTGRDPEWLVDAMGPHRPQPLPASTRSCDAQSQVDRPGTIPQISPRAPA